jgi:two-component system, OmpR family, phosphate regulon response regulator PhoB
MILRSHPTDETIRVLFIENDSAVAEMYKLKLELDGYQVTVIANDDQVLETAASVGPELIYLDLGVGDDQGLATLQQLRATAGTRHVPVIILSNQAASELAGRGFKADALDYVVRAESGPIDLAGNIEVWARAGSG